MPRNKPIPRSQRLIFNRGEKISRNSPGATDDVKNLSVGIMDMDSAIMHYFNEVIKPEVEINKEKVKVHGTAEKWHRYSVWETCNHKSKFIKINHTGSHYQLVVDNERPCSCGEHKGERQSVRLRDRKTNELEQYQ